MSLLLGVFLLLACLLASKQRSGWWRVTAQAVPLGAPADVVACGLGGGFGVGGARSQPV